MGIHTEEFWHQGESLSFSWVVSSEDDDSDKGVGVGVLREDDFERSRERVEDRGGSG